jgi:hypothetical protein
VALNVKQLERDNANPDVLRTRLAGWEKEVTRAGAGSWQTFLDTAKLGPYLADPHAEGVGALTRRELQQTLEVRDQERDGGGRRPQLLREELAAGVFEAGRVGSHLLEWVHQEIHDVRHARERLLVEPVTVVLDADVQLPGVDADRHQVGLVVVEQLPASGLR